MSVCPKCSHENDDVDFCANCGTYLRWEPTRVQPAVKPPEPTPAAAADAPAAEPDARTATPVQPPLDIPAGVLRTTDMPVIRAGEARPAAAPQPGAAGAAVSVQITLSYPELPGEEQKLVAEAGGHAQLPALVRNQSGIVDNYEIRVDGMPEAWWDVQPPAVYLVPFGAPSGSYEQEVVIHFNPPRSAEAEARVWDVEVVAVSKAQGAVAGSTPGRVEITPYEQLESELRPAVVAGHRKGEYALMVRNRANASLDTAVSAVDTHNALTFSFGKSRFVSEPGRRDGTTFVVRPKHTHWVGRSVDRRFDVVAKGAGGQSTARPIIGIFRHKPWIPYWVPIVIPALAAAAVAAYSLIPHKTTVPNLRGQTQAQALASLQKAHLKASSAPPAEQPSRLIPQGHVVSQTPAAGAHVKNGTVVAFTVAEPLVPNLLGKSQSQAKLVLQGRGLQLSASPPGHKVSSKPAGTVVGQVPGAGRPARTGSQISIIVAVGTGLRTVPNVVGLTLPAAEAALRAAGLSIVLPQLATSQNPTTVKISSQIPLAGQTVKANQTVNVYIPAPVPPKKPPKVPLLGGLTATAAAAALAKAGAVPVITREFNVAKPGTVLGQTPSTTATLKPGEKVQLVVSAGYPEIAFSDGSQILAVNGGTGGSQHALTSGPYLQDEPSWQPAGTLVGYRRGPNGNPNAGNIWVVDSARGPSSAHQLTNGPNDRRPAFSPDGKVVAFIRDTTTASGGVSGELCFIRVDSTGRTGACVTGVNVSVDRPTWSPDGRAILVVAIDPSTPNETELGEYTTTQPSTSNVHDWRWRGIVTSTPAPKPGEGALQAAFAPDGKQVAIVANWGSSNPGLFAIFVAAWSNGALGAPAPVAPPIRACEVAWRSDSGELAVTQADNCASASGSIVRVSLADPATVTTVRAFGGQNPAWQPVPLQ